MILSFKCDSCGAEVKGQPYGHEEDGDVCLVCDIDSELLYLNRALTEKKEAIQRLELEVLSLVEKVKGAESKRAAAKGT